MLVSDHARSHSPPPPRATRGRSKLQAEAENYEIDGDEVEVLIPEFFHDSSDSLMDMCDDEPIMTSVGAPEGALDSFCNSSCSTITTSNVSVSRNCLAPSIELWLESPDSDLDETRHSSRWEEQSEMSTKSAPVLPSRSHSPQHLGNRKPRVVKDNPLRAVRRKKSSDEIVFRPPGGMPRLPRRLCSGSSSA